MCWVIVWMATRSGFEQTIPLTGRSSRVPPVALNALGHALLRMEAVDALETHYQGFHQPLRLARPAVRYILSSLGIHDVVWDETQTRVIKAEDGTEGYILARSTECLRRPVAFVFAGECEEKDGSETLLNESILTKSLNYGLIVRGLAYPMFYNGLLPGSSTSPDLRIDPRQGGREGNLAL